MKIKHIIIACLILLVSNVNIQAQNTNTLYFMDGIAERNNVNPAFTPSCNFYLDFIFLPNLYLNLGNNNLILNDFLYLKNGQPTLFLNSQEDIDNFYQKLKPTTDLNVDLGINILSFGFKVKKHYFTFDMGVNADVYAYIPRDLFAFALYGTPDANGVNRFDLSTFGVDASLYSKIGLGYMYQINEHWQIGLKAKFLMGYANINTSIDQLELNASRQSWSLHTDGRINASLPINYNTTEDGNIDFESVSLHDKNQLLSLLYQPAGYGAAIDFGIKYNPIKYLTISASITDLGFIYWNRNLMTGSMKGEHYINELVDYTVGDTLSTDQIVDKFTNLGEEILETIKTEDGQNYTSKLRANFYAGIEYGILKNKISFGVVNHLKFNNNRLWDEATLSVNFRPIDRIRASLNYSFINGRCGNLGLGLNVRTGIFNVYLLADYIPLSFTRIEDEGYKIPIPNKTQSFNLQVGWTWSIGNFGNDEDRDGVKGRKDRCPNTDINFLQRQCPGIKKKKLVDKQGCDLDDDKDGIHNCYDQCSDTPIGAEVDSVGCPVDTDKDGVADYLDNCANTPMGVGVTEKGCPIDSDEDGIADYLDQCPNTPSNILVDSVGCPVDNDKDSVADYVDLCLGTPENVKVDENGCPIDTDKDGVPDFVDQCPETPENTPVNKEGCPLDSDGDGINDGLDKCPQKPGPISNFGCPELKKEVHNLFKKAMTGIQFESGKDIIKRSSYPILDDIVKVMSENADYNLTINGYTDNVGDDEKNLNLSKARATAVLNYIANKGIDAKRLSAFGFGEANPIADNNTSKGRSLNRRVEFEISYTEISYETINTLPTE